ncbi:hypothetical protein C7447_104237 [Tenacibaculum adriaticum]|uniref:PH (Pleckstrin Homology) domain-containing protein n=1 Tax=Tenacibaculum adriaticum TaxID=413713 RepID=A0A5S5DNM0_9FLAO|nr:hypothetical protein [Tenacibaculum adriaticum]TYP97543.1 hypothetical protein C7447_104237 [Tenacibaculum adriaticum]
MKVFKEEQKFTQWWLIVILIFSTITPIVIVFREYQASENTFEGNYHNLIGLTIGVLISVLIFFLKLRTRIDEKGVHYQFFPFHFSLKTILWTEMSNAYTRKYDAISEYGGWGLKGCLLWNKNKGKAINVSGDLGIQLTLNNGKKILIGTQREEEAKRVLETYKEKIKQLNG